MARARRNRHLIKGEGVKWSKEGLSTLYPMAEPFDRGVVRKVTKDGYMVAWNTGFLQALKKPVPAKDHYVGSAGSTSRSWPGTDFEGEAPRARNNKGRPMRFRRARSNVDYTDPSGKTHKGLTFDKYAKLVEKHEGGFTPPPKPSRPRGRGRRKKTWVVSAEKRAGPVSYGQAKNIGHYIGGFAGYCPQAVQIRAHGGQPSHLEALSGMGLTTFGQASDILDAMKDAKVNLWYDHRTDRSKQKAREILSAGGVSCPI